MLNVIVLSVEIYLCYDECHFAECRYADCRYADCCNAECHGAPPPTINKYLRTLNPSLAAWKIILVCK
jgi:hypothetical protein